MCLFQLKKLGVMPPEQPLPVKCNRIYQIMWANNGDSISRQYAGTAALKVTVYNGHWKHFIWDSKSILFLSKRYLGSDDGSLYLISFWNVWLLQEPTIRSGRSGLCGPDGGTVSGEGCSFWAPCCYIFQFFKGIWKYEILHALILFYFETGLYYVALPVLEFTTWS